MIWSQEEYVVLAEFYDGRSTFREKYDCLVNLRNSLPHELRHLNTGWLSDGLPRGCWSAHRIISLVEGSSSFGELRLKAAVGGVHLSRAELRYLAVLLLIYRFQWLFEWKESDPSGLDGTVGFQLSRFVDEVSAFGAPVAVEDAP